MDRAPADQVRGLEPGRSGRSWGSRLPPGRVPVSERGPGRPEPSGSCWRRPPFPGILAAPLFLHCFRCCLELGGFFSPDYPRPGDLLLAPLTCLVKGARRFPSCPFFPRRGFITSPDTTPLPLPLSFGMCFQGGKASQLEKLSGNV